MRGTKEKVRGRWPIAGQVIDLIRVTISLTYEPLPRCPACPATKYRKGKCSVKMRTNRGAPKPHSAAFMRGSESKGLPPEAEAAPKGKGSGSLQSRCRAPFPVIGYFATATGAETSQRDGRIHPSCRRECARIDEFSSNNRRIIQFLNELFTIRARFVHGFFTNQAR